jgi:predicted flap endonuclease-1-like 5' DNA nuclease
MASIETIEGIGAKYGKTMRATGIRSTGALLKAGASAKGRKAVAEKTGFSAHQILEWTNRCDLMRVRGVGEEYSDLLEAAGVDTVKELRNRNAVNLLAKMEEVNAAKKLVRRTPALSMVKRWIAHAKELPPVMTY